MLGASIGAAIVVGPRVGTWQAIGAGFEGLRAGMEAYSNHFRDYSGPVNGSWEALGRLLGGSWRLPRGILD